MPARRKAKTVLIVSSDPVPMQWAKLVLERAGYVVKAATRIEQVSIACQKYNIDLVLLSSSLSPAEKRKFWVELRSECRSPVLELYGSGASELMDESHTQRYVSQRPSDFVEAVRAILDPK